MRFRLLGSLLLTGLVACSGGTDDLDSTQGGIGSTGLGTTPGAPSTGTSPLGGTASAAPGTGSITGGATAPSTGGTSTGSTPGSTTSTGTQPGSGAGNGLPCDVSAILKEKCQTCHGDPLMSGPMKLITWADLQAKSTVKPGENIAARVKARINDTKLPMPPAGRPQLTAQEKQVLEAYIDGGAKQSSASCGATTATATGGTTSGSAGGGTGGLGDYLPPDSECEYMQELRAHAGQTPGDTAPYEAPTGGDHYEIFYFKPMWTKNVHTIRIDPLIDNGAVLHHWLLYMDAETGGDGSHKSDIGLQSGSSQLLSGWAPGNKSIPLGHDIGLQTVNAGNGRFGIEIHYNTGGNPANRKDRSGARICATSKLRAHEAAVHWLGTQLIIGAGKFTSEGTCTVPKESHIIAHSPHMHKVGRYMKTIVAKKSGGTMKVTDMPFAFDDQQIYPVDGPNGEIVVQPGDVITTTCSFDSPGLVTFGPNTADEMCYNFVVAWPVGSLSLGAGIVGGKNTCMDGI